MPEINLYVFKPLPPLPSQTVSYERPTIQPQARQPVYRAPQTVQAVRQPLARAAPAPARKANPVLTQPGTLRPTQRKTR